MMTTRQTLQEILNDYQYHLKTGASKAKAIRILKAQVVDLIEYERHFYYELGREAARYQNGYEEYLKQLPIMNQPSEKKQVTSAEDEEKSI